MGEQRAATPAGVTITATNEDGSTLDITEGVQVLYDLVIQSMDWGSGFLTVEDVEPIVGVAKFCGFKDFQEAQKYLEAERVKEKQRACEHPRWREMPAYGNFTGRVYVRLVCEKCGLAPVSYWTALNARAFRYQRP